MKNMKTLWMVLVVCLGSLPVLAQHNDSLLYKRFPTIPSFNLRLLPDSTIFTKTDLKKNKPTLFFIFSPDCGHCQIATQNMLKHMDLFKKFQIIMATPVAYKWIQPFYDSFKLKNYANLKVGWDASYTLGTFFDVHNFPALFLYNKKAVFVREFKGDINFQEIYNSLK